VVIGPTEPPIEIDWHWSDRYLRGGPHITAIDEGDDASGDRVSSALLIRPLAPAWKRIITGESFGWRYRSLRNRLHARSRRLGRGAVRRMRTTRTLLRGDQPGALREGAYVLVTGRRQPRSIAPELRVPVGVRAIAVDGMRPALALDPFAVAARIAPGMVQIAVTDDDRELAIASRTPLSYYHATGDGRRWLAAHLPHVHAPTGFSPRAWAATKPLDLIASTGTTERRRRRLVSAAREKQAVDCSSTSLDAATAARLIIDLAGAGVPLVASAVPAEVAGLLGPDFVAAVEGCAVDELADPRLRERHSIALRRLVHRHHSVYENLAALAAAHGHTVSALPSVSILMATNRPQMVTFAIEQMAAQQYPNVEILCGLHGISLPAAIRERVAALAPNVQLFDVAADRDLGQVLAQLGERATGDLVTKWDDDDWYATEHLLDLVAAMRYSGAGVVAKPAEYVYLSSIDMTLRRFPTGAETFSTTIAGGTLMLTRSLLYEVGGWPAGPRRVDRLLIGAVEAVGAPIYRMHGLGYLLRRDSRATNHTWLAEDDYFLAQAIDQRPGLDLEFAGVAA
jgi:hypothetical protein